MKVRLNRLIQSVVIAVSFSLTGCGGGSGDDTVENSGEQNNDSPDVVDSNSGSNSNGTTTSVALDGPSNWSVGPANYTLPADVSGVQQNIAGRAIVSVSTVDRDTGNGEYRGSRLTLQLSQGGSGNYTVVDNINLDYGGSRVVFVAVNAGTEVEGLASSKWVSSAGLISVKVDDNGSYHATTLEPLTLTRESNQGSGVPNSPDQISFEMSNIFGRRL